MLEPRPLFMVTNCDLEETESSKIPLFEELSKVTTCDLKRDVTGTSDRGQVPVTQK